MKIKLLTLLAVPAFSFGMDEELKTLAMQMRTYNNLLNPKPIIIFEEKENRDNTNFFPTYISKKKKLAQEITAFIKCSAKNHK